MARTKARETYGNGSISQETRNDEPVRDSWRVCVSLGTETYTDKQGRLRKRRRKVQRTVHGSLKDARAVCKQLVEEYEQVDRDASEMSFADACSVWETSLRLANTCSPARLQDYMTMLGYVSDALGDKPLIEIARPDVEQAIASAVAARKLSQRRHQLMFRTVKRVFEYGIDNGWIVRSPCRGLKTPRVTDEVDRRSLAPEECARLRACLDRDELAAYEAFNAKERRQADWGNTFTRSALFGLSHMSGLVAVRLMLATGCRRGESLGLMWSNVDFDNCQITIRHSLNAQMVLKSPKTKKGVRTVAVDADTMAHLRKWKDFQKKALHLVMLDNGSGNKRPVEQTQKTPVCCNCVGGFLDPTNLYRWWGDYRATIGFDGLRLHELRHTQATMLLGAGTDVKTVQTRLGHASASLTLDVYGHAIPANDKAAADFMGAVMGVHAEPSAQVLELGKKTA